ncbi:hypothetical protein MBLNU13_g06593t1 [Cladosporium sp. NU13]
MDVVGTASAVLGILQVGFSLAKAIRETVKDYKDAADDLIGLAQEIESTLYLVSQLDRLVVDNKKTGTFNDGGLAELNRCLKNTEQIVEALVELLTKTGVSHPPGTKVNPENLIISRPHRRKWLGQKSRVKDKQEELNKVRLEVTTIILLRDTLQADPNSNKAMQQALVAAERDRRRKARTHRKRQNRNAQIRQPTADTHKLKTGMHPIRIAIPSPPRTVRRNGRRGLESFAYQVEVSPPDPIAENPIQRTMPRSDRADDDPDSNKIAMEKEVAGEDANGSTASENVGNGKKATGNSADEDTMSDNPAYASVGNLGSNVAVDSALQRLASGISPAIPHSVYPSQPELSREAIIEEFKRQTKADGMKLSEAYQAMMERAMQHAGRDEPDHGLRRFVESEYAQEWSGMFGDWLPGTRPELAGSPIANKVKVKTSKLPKWSFNKAEHKQYRPTTPESQSLDIPRSAHLLVVQRQADKPNILRLNPPDKLQRPDLHKTGLIWSNFEDDIKEAIWQTLRLEFVLPGGLQWILHDATILHPGPSLLTRGLLRLVPRLEYKKVNSDSYIVVFVSTKSKQSRTGGFGQVDIADHDTSGGPTGPVGAISGPYSQQNYERLYRPETAITPQELHYIPNYAEDAARDPRRYTDSPAFPRHGSGRLADRIPLGPMPSDWMLTKRVPINRIPADRMPSYEFPQPLYAMSPPNNADRDYQQEPPRCRDRDSPGRNGYPPLSEETRVGAQRPRMPARLPSPARRSALLESDLRRPNRRIASTGLFDGMCFRPPSGSNQSSSKLDSSDESGDRGSGYDTRGDSPRRDRRYHRDARRRPGSLRSDDDDMESGDRSDDSLDDDELYDQLLRKFTGRGLRERQTTNGDSDGRVNGGTKADVDGNADQDGIGDESIHVDAGDTDKIIDGFADDRAIE